MIWERSQDGRRVTLHKQGPAASPSPRPPDDAGVSERWKRQSCDLPMPADPRTRSRLPYCTFPSRTGLHGKKHVSGSDRRISKSASFSRRDASHCDGHRICECEDRKPTRSPKALEELRVQSKERYVPALYFGAIYEGLGDSDVSMSWLEKAYREHSDYLIYLNVDPMADTLRSSPRFQAIVRKIGIGNKSELTGRDPHEQSQ